MSSARGRCELGGANRRLATPAEEPGTRLVAGGLLAQSTCTCDNVGRPEGHQLRAFELRELGTLDPRKPQRLRVQRLLEERPDETGVAEAFATRSAGQDPPP